jgi:hypothetical protein
MINSICKLAASILALTVALTWLWILYKGVTISERPTVGINGTGKDTEIYVRR